LARSVVVECRNCQQEIFWDDDVTSKNGKKIPLQADEEDEDGKPKFHDCPNNPFKAGKGKSNYDTPKTGNVGFKRDQDVNLELVSRIGKLETDRDSMAMELSEVRNVVRELGEALAQASFKKANEV
jgi:hypothetical protein